jgi:hypothetical protein
MAFAMLGARSLGGAAIQIGVAVPAFAAAAFALSVSTAILCGTNQQVRSRVGSNALPRDHPAPQLSGAARRATRSWLRCDVFL